MDLSPLEYTAQASSPFISGEVKLAIGEKALTLTALFGAAEIPFAEVNALTLTDYVVTVKADSGDSIFSRMGNWCQPFYHALADAYNKAVLRALFVSGKPVLAAKGNYTYNENGTTTAGAAPVQIYENSVVCLPTDLGARRVPLCFAVGLDSGEYELRLRLGTGETYTFTKLGYDSAPFAAAVEKQIRSVREKSLAAVKELDSTLTGTQASQLAGLLPEGAAAPIGQLAQIAPSFAAALEDKIAATRAAEAYKMFKEISDPSQIYVGFLKNDIAEGAGGAKGLLGAPGGGLGEALGGLTDGGGAGGGLGDMLGGLLGGGGGAAADGEAAVPDPYLLWLIAPSPDGLYATVEFGEANSATFVYRTGGDYHGFAKQLNRALEAIAFKREVIRLTDDELRKPENADYYMAVKRTTALRFVRAHFAGRVIHSNPTAWKQSLLEYFGGAHGSSPPAS